MSDDAGNERDEVLDDELDDEDEYDDEIAPEGNRILGARARAVVEHVTRNVAEEPEAVEIDVAGHLLEVRILRDQRDEADRDEVLEACGDQGHGCRHVQGCYMFRGRRGEAALPLPSP